MEDVLLGREAASARDCSQGSDFRKSIGLRAKTLNCHHPIQCTYTALAGCLPCLPAPGAHSRGAVCWGSSKAWGNVDTVVCLSSRLCLLDLEATHGISFSSFSPQPCGKMRCPHKAIVRGPCRLACANTLLSNDLICNEAKCWCSSF